MKMALLTYVLFFSMIYISKLLESHTKQCHLWSSASSCYATAWVATPFVASNNSEPRTRRAEAAYQFAMLSLRNFRWSTNTEVDEKINLPLQMLYQAASQGHSPAQWVAGYLYESFGRSTPFIADVEALWLVDGTCHGSMAARRRLSSLFPEKLGIAMNSLRFRFSGMGIELPPDDDNFDDNMKLYPSEIFSRAPERILQLLAFRGQAQHCRN